MRYNPLSLFREALTAQEIADINLFNSTGLYNIIQIALLIGRKPRLVAEYLYPPPPKK